MTEADPALAVAHHHQGGERETTTAFDGRGHTVDVDQLFNDVAVRAVGLGSVAVVTTIAIVAAAAALGLVRHAAVP